MRFLLAAVLLAQVVFPPGAPPVRTFPMPTASSGTVDPLSVGLEHYWTLDEGTGDPKQDSIGTAYMDTPVGTDAAFTANIEDVISIAGKAGNAIQAENPNPKKLLASFESLHSIFNGDAYGVVAWMYSGPAIATSQMWRTNVPGINTEYSQMYASSFSGVLRFYGSIDNTDNPSCLAFATFNSYETGWYLAAYTVDTTTDEITVWARHATLGNIKNTVTCTNRNLALSSASRAYIQGVPVGADPPTFQAYNGFSDETMVFSRKLTDDDIDLLWCNGAGKFLRNGVWECPS